MNTAPYTFTATPPSGWDSACSDRSTLFGSRDWQQLLESGFDCHTVYGWNGRGGAAITIFRAGPFRIGYLGFPVGNLVGDAPSTAQLLSDLRSSRLNRLPVCIRVPVSGFMRDGRMELPSVSNPETAIRSLQDWQLSSVSKNLRRDIRKSERSELRVAVSADPAQARSLYRIYKSTVERNRGVVRYTERYFDELLHLACRNPAVRVYTAGHESTIAGFAVILHHERIAFYLHGGTVDRYRTNSPSDLLLSRAIMDSKASGADQFNLMASPGDQPSLVRYKEKWGAETRVLRTYTCPLSPMYRLFNTAERLYTFFARGR